MPKNNVLLCPTVFNETKYNFIWKLLLDYLLLDRTLAVKHSRRKYCSQKVLAKHDSWSTLAEGDVE